MKVTHNPLVKMIAKLRMRVADVRGHHGKRWDYEHSEHYLGMKKSKKALSKIK